MRDELIKLAKDGSFKSILDLHEILREYGIEAVYLPKNLKDLLDKQISSRLPDLIALEGKYGSGKTGLLVASYLFYKDKGIKAYIEQARKVLSEGSKLRILNEYEAILLDELERAVRLANEEELEELAAFVRDAAEDRKYLVLSVKESATVDQLNRISGAGVPTDRIVYFNTKNVREEINRELIKRNLAILELVYEGIDLRKLRKALDKERGRYVIVPPRVVNYATLSYKPGIEIGEKDEDVIERAVRRYFSKYQNTRIIEGLIASIERAIVDRRHGSDVELEISLRPFGDDKEIGRYLLGIEVKAYNKPNIDVEQYRRFRYQYDHVLYMLFIHYPDKTKIASLTEKYNITILALPRTLFYIATHDENAFKDSLNTVLSEDDKIREAIERIIKHKISAEKLVEAKEKGLKNLVEAVCEYIKIEKLVERARANKSRRSTRSIKKLREYLERKLSGVPLENLEEALRSVKAEIENCIGTRIEAYNEKLVVFA